MKTVKYTQIKSLEELEKAIPKGEAAEGFIIFENGCRSSKCLYRESKNTWRIINYVDESEQRLTSPQIYVQELTNIGVAMRTGNFYLER